MFGFGLFSTHLPYLVLIIGYIVCWCWNVQAKPGTSAEEDHQAVRIEIAQPEAQVSEEGAIGYTSFSAATLSALPSGEQLLFFSKEKDNPLSDYLSPIITSEHRSFSFLRPPPQSVLS